MRDGPKPGVVKDRKEDGSSVEGGQGPVQEGRPEEWLGQVASLCWLSKELGFYSGDNESRCRGLK